MVRHLGPPGTPVAIESLLGWMICGRSQVPLKIDSCYQVVNDVEEAEGCKLKFELKKRLLVILIWLFLQILM